MALGALERGRAPRAEVLPDLLGDGALVCRGALPVPHQHRIGPQQHERVARVERGSERIHLDRVRRLLRVPLHLEELGAAARARGLGRRRRLLAARRGEARAMAAFAHDEPPVEDAQEVLRLLALLQPHLRRLAAQRCVLLRREDRRRAALVLRRLRALPEVDERLLAARLRAGVVHVTDDVTVALVQHAKLLGGHRRLLKVLDPEHRRLA
mmetsp:Transcript_3673/g.9543  ORF Transcript_3673/g.9543 Transcript_3673/m.9543 type:complete len:211 (+) Transcript_3673:1292-1924(+)